MIYMGNNEEWDREENVKKRFDPNNITEWLEYSPDEFIAQIVIELRQENTTISAWSKLLDENPQFRAQVFQINDQEIDAAFFTEVIMRAARITTRLLDTASAYREQLSDTGDQEQ